MVGLETGETGQVKLAFEAKTAGRTGRPFDL
jgi:hypothetical protein